MAMSSGKDMPGESIHEAAVLLKARWNGNTYTDV
jgi:hypothetical protein